VVWHCMPDKGLAASALSTALLLLLSLLWGTCMFSICCGNSRVEEAVPVPVKSAVQPAPAAAASHATLAASPQPIASAVPCKVDIVAATTDTVQSSTDTMAQDNAQSELQLLKVRCC